MDEESTCSFFALASETVFAPLSDSMIRGGRMVHVYKWKLMQVPIPHSAADVRLMNYDLH